MKKLYSYKAIFTEEYGGITVVFPSLLGAITCADSFEEAVKDAEECLKLYLESCIENEGCVPNDTAKINLEENETEHIITVELDYVSKLKNILKVLDNMSSEGLDSLLDKAMKEIRGKDYSNDDLIIVNNKGEKI